MKIQHSLDDCLWYALHTNPRQEIRAESNLKAWGIETYLPRINESYFDRYKNSYTSLIKPLFTRYLFARFRYNAFGYKIRHTRGIKDIVSFGEAPIPVDSEIIDLIQSRQDDFGYVKLEDGISQGDEVVIADGMFKGIHGIFERKINNSDRVMILLKAIQYQAHIVIDREFLRKIQALS